MAPPDFPLGGAQILVTRPAHQSDALCTRIEAAGGRALRLPLIEIQWIHPGAPPGPLPDLVIFTSANAVEGLERAWGPLRPLLVRQGGPRVAAIGPATRRRLESSGVPVVLQPPSGFTSEALLERLDAGTLNGRPVWIVKGLGGRRMLRDALQEAGARVETVAVYRRVRTRQFPEAVGRALRAGEVAAALVTSAEILCALKEYLEAVTPNVWQGIILVAAGTRVAALARKAGFARVVQARDPGDEAMVGALVRHLEAHSHRGGFSAP